MPKPPVHNSFGQLHDELLDIFINAIDHTEYDLDTYLDSRDEPEFDGAWVRADEAVEAVKKSFADAGTLEAAATKLRQAVFMHCIRALGHPDLAAYVSDDAGLLFDAKAMEVDNEWIAGLLASYREGKLPAGPGYEAAAAGV
jgi:hypothetical protein